MKSQNHLDKCIVCPKCQSKTMRKSIGQGFGEYYDDKCHQYFTIEELVNVWGYDFGDFYGGIYVGTELTSMEKNRATLLLIERNSPKSVAKKLFSGGLSEMDYAVAEKLIMAQPNTVSPSFELEWNSKLERDLDYEEVTAMQLGIPSYALEDWSVDTGAVHP